MEIKILGAGCATCDKLYQVVQQAATQAGIGAPVDKVQDVQAILAYGVIAQPALLVNGEVVSSGRVPDAREISIWLTTAAVKEHGTA